MPSSKDRKPEKAVKNKSPRTDPPPATSTAWWKKPPRWIGGVLLVALGAALHDPLQFLFGRLIENVYPRVGDPISAVATLEPALYDVVLTRPQALSEQDLDSLTGLAPYEQTSRLEEKGGIPLGTRKIKVTLQSNRPYPVRVTGMKPVSECEEPIRGTLVKTALGGRGETRISTVIVMHVDDPGKGAEVQDPGKEGEPFFPGRTITLTAPERDFVVLELWPSKTKLCRAHVEITVVDGDREVRQLISPRDGGVPLLPFDEGEEHEAAYSSVYLAGGICQRPVLAKEGYLSNVSAACGPNNLGTELKQSISIQR